MAQIMEGGGDGPPAFFYSGCLYCDLRLSGFPVFADTTRGQDRYTRREPIDASRDGHSRAGRDKQSSASSTYSFFSDQSVLFDSHRINKIASMCTLNPN